MDANKRVKRQLDVEELAIKRVKSRKKRDLNETIFFEFQDKKVPVFTQEFLEQNRLAEVELRKLRKLNNDYEEHNSVLVKYIENLSTACDQACEEVKELTQFRDSLASKLTIWKTEIKDKFGVSIDEDVGTAK